ncbi:hypothetical protein [Sinorhizobium fredii]|uniref:hypothetical protein n=1 Tax=Rhizobium fredii TaxID=380 RepID=UPI0004AFAC00|nr:hypothetical protein [Sinorhizobium fredii]AWM24081.1 hypothetical protein AOX55_0000804 [Sinorhizobium fredii CCBAU 25509]
MLHLKTETISIRSARIRSDWASALRNVADVASSADSFLAVRAAVADAKAAFMAEARTFKMPIDDHEFGTSITNALACSGFHRDRHGDIHRLADLIRIDFPHFGNEFGRPCLRFSIQVTLEDGSLSTSRETLEWLHKDGVVTEGSYADLHPEAFVETARALDAFMTDVETAVRDKLDGIVRLSRPIRYAIVVARHEDGTSVPLRLVPGTDQVPMAFPNAAEATAIQRELSNWGEMLGCAPCYQPIYEVRHVNRLPNALREEIVKWHGDVLVKPEAA